MPKDLIDWIKNEFPEREVVYRGKAFRFHGDVPIGAMTEIRDFEGDQVEKIKIFLKVLSIEPKITVEVLAVMGSEMLMTLYSELNPKKPEPISPIETIEPISLPK